jgi:hypothetical protein
MHVFWIPLKNSWMPGTTPGRDEISARPTSASSILFFRAVAEQRKGRRAARNARMDLDRDAPK